MLSVITILIAQQIAECPRKQEENVQLEGVWVFHSVLQRGLEVECLRCLKIPTPFVAALGVHELCSVPGGHPWRSAGGVGVKSTAVGCRCFG